MGVSGDASVLLARYKQRVSEAKKIVPISEKKTKTDILKEAIRLSSGTDTYADLRRKGYPYARRNPTASNPEVINAHDGSVLNGWKVVFTNGDPAMINVTNSSPWIVFLLGGTMRMISRPIGLAIVFAIYQPRLDRLAANKSKALD